MNMIFFKHSVRQCPLQKDGVHLALKPKTDPVGSSKWHADHCDRFGEHQRTFSQAQTTMCQALVVACFGSLVLIDQLSRKQ